MNIRSLIEADLIELKKKYQSTPFGEYPLLAVEDVPNDGILFVGLNPSIPEKERKETMHSEGISLFYSHDKANGHPYFRRFIEVAENITESTKTEINWGHIDLLYMRVTNQGKIGDLVWGKGKEKGREFIEDQLKISKRVLTEIIDKANPKVIVVNNSLAREFLGLEASEDDKKDVWLGFQFDWDKEIGTYTHKGIPVFFTSMLTGQRALDNGSYKRLIWHIEFALKYKSPRQSHL